MSEARDKIVAMIGAIRGCWVRRELSMLALSLTVALFLWLGTMVLLDNTLMFSSRGLMLGWVVLLLTAAAGATASACRFTIGRPSSRELAIRFESQVSQQHNRLVNSIDFIDSHVAERDPMARAAVVENALHLDATQAPRAIDWQMVRMMVLAAAACLLVLLGYSMFRASFVANAIQRLLNPIHPAPHILVTEIEVSPGNAQLIEGDSLVIEAKLGRHLPGEAAVEYRIGDGGWTRASMQSIDDRTFHYDGLKGLWQDLQYRVTAGRSTSATYAASVRLRPKVQSVQLAVTPPAYTGAPEKLLPKDQGDVTALPGSSVQIKIAARSPLASARLEMSEGPAISLDVAAKAASGVFILNTTSSYAIVIADTSQPKPLTNLSPPRYALTVLEDQPPNAIFNLPGRDLILPADATVSLKLDADDDWGLANVAIEIKSGSAEWKPIARAELPLPGEKRKIITANLSLAAYRLKPGEMLLYRAVAADHRQPTPNTFVGRPWSIAISTATGDAPLLAADAKKMLDSLQAILTLQKEARGEVDMDRDVHRHRRTGAACRWTDAGSSLAAGRVRRHLRAASAEKAAHSQGAGPDYRQAGRADRPRRKIPGVGGKGAAGDRAAFARAKRRGDEAGAGHARKTPQVHPGAGQGHRRN